MAKFKVWRYGDEKTGAPLVLDITDGGCPACEAAHANVKRSIVGILFLQVLDEADRMRLHRVQILGGSMYLCGVVELAEADAELRRSIVVENV